MSFALTIVLLALMIALFDLFVPPRATWARLLVDRYAVPVPAGSTGGRSMPVVGLLSEDLVERRLRALSAELAYLDRDRSRFAIAFRTRVARDAYRALQDDALRLAELRARTVDLGGGGTVVEVDVWTPPGRGRREELEH